MIHPFYPSEPVHLEAYAGGSTEPWTTDLICQIVRSLGATRVLECGGFEGATTRKLLQTGAEVTVIEVDEERARVLSERYRHARVICGDALSIFQQIENETFDVIFLDDDHHCDHVRQEIETILDRGLAPVILLHDVVGPFGLGPLVREFQGVVLPMPQIHVAGGLGIISR